MDSVSVDDDPVGVMRTIKRQHAVDAVVLDQVRHCLVVGDVVDGCDFKLWMVDQQPEKIPADASEAVDGDFCFQMV
jgi:hypothetical protein